MTTKHQLVVLKLPKGPGFDQVEALVQELRHAKTCLVAVQAQEELFTDAAMIGTLLNKLPTSVQPKWYENKVAIPHTSAVEEGHVFEQWLNKLGYAATMRRLTMLATELSHGPAASVPMPSAVNIRKQTCGRCK